MTSVFTLATGLLIGCSLSATANDSACRRFADCRPLHQKEIRMLRPIFGDTVPYHAVRIIKGPQSYVKGVFKHAPTMAIVPAPDNRIYAYKGFHAADYTRTSFLGSVLVHEMMHVWQWKSGQGLRIFGLGALKLAAPTWNSYHYDLQKNPRLAQYNTEQQASIAEDFFLETRLLVSGRATAALCGEWHAKKKLLQQELPVTVPTPALCR